MNNEGVEYPHPNQPPHPNRRTGDTGTNARRFLESIHLYLWPYAAVVIYGRGEDVHAALRNPTLRNTVHALYLVTEELDGPGRGKGGVQGNSSLVNTGE